MYSYFDYFATRGHILDALFHDSALHTIYFGSFMILQVDLPHSFNSFIEGHNVFVPFLEEHLFLSVLNFCAWMN